MTMPGSPRTRYEPFSNNRASRLGWRSDRTATGIAATVAMTPAGAL